MEEQPTSISAGIPEIIREHATAIGVLCIYCATLDNVLSTLIERLIGVDELEAACIVASAPETSHRCEMIRRLATLKIPEGPFRDALIGMTNRVQNEIGPKRNRIVHDDWFATNDEMFRVDRRTKIQKVQSRQAESIVHRTTRTASVAETEEVITLVAHMIGHLTMIGLVISQWRKDGRPLELPESAIELSKPNGR